MKHTNQPLSGYEKFPEEVMEARAFDFYKKMKHRRTVRNFSEQPVDLRIIENCLRAASTAPSGANQQPWQFVVVGDTETKKQIRQAAEEEEEEFYGGRAGEKWLADLEHLGTNAQKQFLENAPALIVIFARSYDVSAQGDKSKNYYVQESVGIATGILITSLHHCGLATLTHTPSPMKFLNEVLDRPREERAYMIIVAGYPDKAARVPVIGKKSLEQIACFRE